jgi:hypothetical protein
MNTPVILTDADRIKLKAVNELLGSQSAITYQEELEEMFEGWITSYLGNGLNENDRARIWFCYRVLKEFFEGIKAVS